MKCARCGFEVPTGAKFCRNCGASITSPAPQPAPTVPQDAAGSQASAVSQTCPSCGAAVTAGKKFCRACGAALGVPPRARQPKGPSPITQLARTTGAGVRTVLASRRVRLAVVTVAVLAVVAVALWKFLPRELLPPKEVGTILNRATSGPFITFNEGVPGRRALLLSTGADIWEIPSGKTLYHGATVGYYLSPDGDTFLASDGPFLWNWRNSRRIALENPAPTWVSVVTGGGFGNRYQRALFSRDGTLLAASRPNGSLYVLDAKTGRVAHLLRKGSNQLTPPSSRPSATCVVTDLAFSPNGKLLASGELNGDVTLWNPASGDQERIFRGEASQPCEGTAPQTFDWRAHITSIAFSPDGHLLATSDGYGILRIWNAATGTLRHTLSSPLGPAFPLKFSPDGRFLVSSSPGGPGSPEMCYIWDVARGRLLQVLSFPGRGDVDFSSNGDLIVADLVDGRAKVEEWALRSRFRLPFVSSAQDVVAQSDPAVTKAYEGFAIRHLSFLEDSLGQYMGGKGNGSFPASLQEISKNLANGRGYFQEDLAGYRFEYTPGQADGQGHITSFVLSARPLFYKQTGTRSFRVDQAGQAYATEENREATTTDAVLSGLTSAIQVNLSARIAAGQQAASHLTRARILFQQRQFQAAIGECDAVLKIDPSNQEAAKLKARIQQTMSILGVR